MEQRKLVSRHLEEVEVDGLRFKDHNKDGRVNPYEDWRLSPEERAKDLVGRMNLREKAGMMVLIDKPMGISAEEGEPTSHDGVINEADKEIQYPHPKHEYPTSTLLEDFQIRHIILRENAEPEEIMTWVNTMQEMVEESRLGIPLLVLSNSKNENNEAAFNAESAIGRFTQFPGTLGLAATRNMPLIKAFAEIGKQEFWHNNIRKGYMYMVDTATDPRWFRTSGTFGENPEQISEIAETIIPVYQGEDLDDQGVALTIKHFPGGGARENGFDPHYEEGKFNVYPTPNSLETYHLPPFKAAIKHQPSSIMPYYAIPSQEKSNLPQEPFQAGFEEDVAFAYNRQFLQELLRDDLGFKGYINSDTGVLDACAWGVEDLTKPERVAKMLKAGTNIVSGTTEVEAFEEAMTQGLVDEETVNARLEGTLKELFALGLFENPYQDIDQAEAITNTEDSREIAYQAHQESVVLLKNDQELLPLTEDKLAGKKVYAEIFTKVYNEEEMASRRKQGIFGNTDELNQELPEQIRKAFPQIDLVTDYHEADIALLFLEPISGSYFEATSGYLDLQIHQATNVDLDRVKAIQAAVDHTIINVNLDLPFILENVEPLADALTASFNSFIQAIIDVYTGACPAKGKLPLTLPANDDVIAVNDEGICASPNDVPGYDKDKYMDRAYAYQDSAGNSYTYGFGLSLN